MMYNELVQSIQNFENLNLLVVGDVMLDRYIVGDVDRISQEAPVPIVSTNKIESILGGAANVANCIKSLGASCTVIGQIGNDENGYILKNMLSMNGINPVLNINSNIITTTKNRILSRTNQQMMRYDEEIIRDISSAFVESFIYTKLDTFDAVIVSDYGKGAFNDDLLKYINEKCYNQKKPIFLDPSPKTEYKTKTKSIYLLPNKSEAKQIDLSKFGTKIITRGTEGIEIDDGNSSKYIVKPLKVQQVWNTTGAGDIVTSVFSLSKISGLDLFKSALLSNIAAGISIKQPVTYPVSKEELSQEVFYNKDIIERRVNYENYR